MLKMPEAAAASLTNAASKSMFYLFFGFCQKRILILTPISL